MATCSSASCTRPRLPTRHDAAVHMNSEKFYYFLFDLSVYHLFAHTSHINIVFFILIFVQFARLLASNAIGTKVALTSAAKYPLVPLCRATFNTAFVGDSMRLSFSKHQLDAVFAGPLTSPLFPTDFQLTLVFARPGQQLPMSVLAAPVLPTLMSAAPSSMPLLPDAPGFIPTGPSQPPAAMHALQRTQSGTYANMHMLPAAGASLHHHVAAPESLYTSTPVVPPWVAAHTSDSSLVHPSGLASTLTSPPTHNPNPRRNSDTCHTSAVYASAPLTPSASAYNTQWSSAAPPPVLLPLHSEHTSASTSAWSTPAPSAATSTWHTPATASASVDPLQMSVLPTTPAAAAALTSAPPVSFAFTASLPSTPASSPFYYQNM